MSSGTFSAKDPNEVLPFGFDCAKSIIWAAGESIATVAFSMTQNSPASPADPGLAAMLSGTGVVNGKVVTQTVINGLNGNVYELKATVTTSLSKVFVESGILPVADT